jgi:hypothetical protein
VTQSWPSREVPARVVLLLRGIVLQLEVGYIARVGGCIALVGGIALVGACVALVKGLVIQANGKRWRIQEGGGLGDDGDARGKGNECAERCVEVG